MCRNKGIEDTLHKNINVLSTEGLIFTAMGKNVISSIVEQQIDIIEK